MNYKISIIIPVYNAQEYLNRCVDSVINQSIGFENLELILVDDNSSDDSKNIIQDYAKKYSNIKPIYLTENHGYPGFGRNRGIQESSANYIMFMDNDDEYDLEMCEKLYKTIIDEKADIVACDRVVYESKDIIKHNINYKNGIEKNGKIIIKNDDILLFESHVIWNKIYKKDLIFKNNIKFITDSAFDDVIFSIKYYYYSHKLIYIKNYFGYHWLRQHETLSNSINYNYLKKCIKYFPNFIDFLKENNKDFYANLIFKGRIAYLIWECSMLKNNYKPILIKIYELEKKYNFNGKLPGLWVNTINKLILKKHFILASMILKFSNILRNSFFLKIYRSFLNKN